MDVCFVPVGYKSIQSQGRWFSASEFEKFAGKGSSKNWKQSISCQNTPLQKLIEVNIISDWTGYCKRFIRQSVGTFKDFFFLFSIFLLFFFVFV